MDDQELAGLRVAIYARYSSDAQRDASIEDQVRRCRTFIEARGGLADDALVFADRAVSGASMDRPEFLRMSALATSTPPQVDVIVTEDLSRVGRDQADLHHFKRSLEFSRVRLVGVADGLDTAAAHGALTFAMKGMIAEVYLRELRDKTKRGLEGRALKGFATGGVPFGFTTSKRAGPGNEAIGSVIEVDPAAAEVVRTIFALYLDGHSLAAIAKRLNNDRVPPPRVHVAGRRVGWKDSTIRAMLHNERYIGRWTYNEREWRKLPGTNKRRYRQRAAHEVIRLDRPDLRIVDLDVWTAAQERLEEVARHYRPVSSKGGQLSRPGRRTPYLFSSLLYCQHCGSKMVVSGGSSTAYYRCEGHSKRGTCGNALSVREDVLRASLLDELRHRLASPRGIATARERVAQRLGEMGRERNAALVKARSEVAKREADIERLIQFITDGNGTKAVATALKTREAELEACRREVARLEQRSTTPPRLPSVDEMMQLVLDLEHRLLADVTRGREELRRLFRDGRIDLVPQKGGFYVARSEILPMVLLMQPPSEESLGGRYTASSCAGRI